MTLEDANQIDAATGRQKTHGIVPCLWFDDRAEQAAEFYAATFSSGRVTNVTHYPEGVENPSGRPPGSPLSVSFELDGTRFAAINGGPHFHITPSISFFVESEAPDDTDRLFSALAEDGEAFMPLDAYPWSERYAWVRDRFGTSWQLITVDEVSESGPIYPCLLFSDDQRGRGEEAMQFYVDVFPDSRIDRIERYSADEGPQDYVKHGRFFVDGQLIVVTDSHIPHGFSFNEGVSLQVMCPDQASIDYYWERLSDGGRESRCGWLEDRFGISWQVIPAAIDEWLYSEDGEASARAFEVMLGMNKLDISQLRTAAGGGR